jgi:hypothetical protein
VSRRRLLGIIASVAAGLLALAPAASGAADSITVVQRDVDVNPGEVNPCNGAVGTILDDEQDVFHITALATGGLHLSGHSTVAVSFVPDDPSGVRYDGHETFAFGENDSGTVSTTTMTNRVRVRGTDGTFLTVGEVAHFTFAGDRVAVDFDRPSLVCS